MARRWRPALGLALPRWYWLETRWGCTELIIHIGVTCGVVAGYVRDSLSRDGCSGVSRTPLPGARPEAALDTLDGHCLLNPFPARLALFPLAQIGRLRLQRERTGPPDQRQRAAGFHQALD